MRRRRRARVGQERRKRENKRPILKKLCAALLRSFRGQHSEKMKGSARGNWDPREGQQPFRPNPNGAGDRTTTLRRLLIGAGELVQLRRLNERTEDYYSSSELKRKAIQAQYPKPMVKTVIAKAKTWTNKFKSLTTIEAQKPEPIAWT